VFYRSGETASGGGVLLLVSFKGVKGGMRALRFGSSRMEEGGSRWRMARRHGRRGGGADGSRWWETMEARGGSRWKPEVGADVSGQKAERSRPVSVGVKER
jgi:hypothetical protein